MYMKTARIFSHLEMSPLTDGTKWYLWNLGHLATKQTYLWPKWM